MQFMLFPDLLYGSSCAPMPKYHVGYVLKAILPQWGRTAGFGSISKKESYPLANGERTANLRHLFNI